MTSCNAILKLGMCRYRNVSQRYKIYKMFIIGLFIFKKIGIDFVQLDEEKIITLICTWKVLKNTVSIPFGVGST